IDGQRARAPPRAVVQLRAGPLDEAQLHSKRSGWIGGLAARIPYGWRNDGARDAVAESDVSCAIHRNAAHPAVARGQRVGSLLDDRRRCPRTPYLVPADSSDAPTRVHRVVDDERLVVTEVSIGESRHQSIADGVERLRRVGLGDAAPARPACVRESGNGNARGPDQGRGATEVRGELPEIE